MQREQEPSSHVAPLITILVIVFVLLGGFVALVVPRMVSRSTSARHARAKADLASISKVLHQFRRDVGRYPTKAEGFAVLVKAPATLARWRGPYFAGSGPDPWGHGYVYLPHPASDSFDLVSYGSDGVAGGTGSGADIYGR